ncbi:putative domain HDIG-containing protein [Nostoc sp. PCC 7524]|uniref:HD family phosphohydrolase n=1 Tax=Nostoc sp. (strain ATCC 29411 / PCC 7524) TaxID=28072 RepID=UPI00029EF7D9|nr:HD family phosphohydrolase [Nostoc sp. PCC 7524]AFY50179.1 putative domain HDIG-containing protein [Nostoc sp. PCC 7524]
MKTQRFFHSLNQQLNHWRRRYKLLSRKGKSTVAVSRKSKPSSKEATRVILNNILLNVLKNSYKNEHQKRKIDLRAMAKLVKNRSRLNAVGLGWVHEKRSSLILAIAVASLTGVMGHRLYNQPKLKVGTIAPQTIKAPYTDKIEDQKKTDAQRKNASKSSTPILMVDAEITEQVNQNLQKLLDEGNEIRAISGSFPFFDASVLSIPTQHYLRSCSDAEWQTLLKSIENVSNQKQNYLFRARTIHPINNTNQNSQIQNNQTANLVNKSEFTQALAELVAYRISTAEQNLSALITQISQARQAYAQATVQLQRLNAITSETIYSETVLLELSDDEWTKTQSGIAQSAERMLTQGIPHGLPKSILQNAVSLQLQAFVPRNAETLATKVLLAVLEPNLKQDEEKTKQQAQKAANDVLPVIIEVKQGQVIINRGDQITEWHFDILEHYQLIRRENNWLGLLKLATLLTGAIAVFVVVERRSKYHLRQRDRLLVLLLTLSTPGLLAMGVPYTTWGGVGLLLGSFYGPSLGITVMVLMLLLLPITLEVSIITVLAGAVGGILGSGVAQRLRSREELALLGVAIAVTQGGVYLLIKLLIGAAFGSAWYIVLQEAGLLTVSGLAWSIVALGLSPYLEKLFDLVTPIRLAELANPNRPLLKRLATETPGTFQHTLSVATLAEAAAKKLGCNVELVRAGTLYHDIGKMHDPLGFIENQMGGPNKHETEIKDPWKSAEIIKKHVSEGLVMARKHLLPTAIQAFIPEHQGTMLIAYFYHQAEQMAQADPSIVVDEADFRYAGPIPQSRETGIVMLADACEAALRSLKDVNPEQALTMLNNILRARWQDNQLIDSGLTREEMTQIAEIFVEVWQQFHHKRIAYPKLKAKNVLNG